MSRPSSVLALCFPVVALLCTPLFALDAAPLTAPAESPRPELAEGPEQVVVTAARDRVRAGESASSLTVITRPRIESSGAALVSDLLREVPGADVVREGGAGQKASLFLRGANSDHTLVLIDGVEASDPSNPNGAFDFSSLSLDNVERIEILRGPQSVLWGSSALGGVVNIVTRSSGSGGSVAVGGGSFGMGRLRGDYRGNGFSLSASAEAEDGISAAAGGAEADGSRRQTLSLRWGSGAAGQPGWDVTVRAVRSHAELDEYNGATFLFGDDPDSVTDKEELFARGAFRFAGGGWLHTAGAALTEVSRESDNPADAVNPDRSEGSYRGERLKADWQSRRAFGRLDLTAGAELARETADSRFESESFLFGSTTVTEIEGAEAETGALFLLGRWGAEKGTSLSAGARYDDHSQFGGEATWRVEGSWAALPGVRLHGGAGTGFAAPSLFQLHDPVYGNPDLDPERSRGWDAGAEWSWGAGKLDLTRFGNRFTDLVGYDALYRAVNIGRAWSRGWEGSLVARPSRGFALRASVTLTETEDEATGEPLLRRPEEKHSLALAFGGGGDPTLTLENRWVGERSDYVGWSVGTLPPYRVLSAAAVFPLSPRLTLTLRGENLLKEEYQEAAGYGAPGRSGSLTLAAGF